MPETNARTKKVLAPFTLFVVAALGAACGASEAETAKPAPAAPPTATGEPTTEPPAPAPTGTTTTTPPPPKPEPEWVWTPPVVPTTSAGCGIARADDYGTAYTTPGGRQFHVWGPPGYDPSKTYPVVLMYHGIYATGPAFESWFKMEDHVEGQAFVVYPSAIGNAWDVVNANELTYFDEMMKMLADTYCINPSRVLAFGFSYGGSMASQIACKRAGYVKALSVGDGSWGGSGMCGRLPVLMTHRTHDPDELIAWGRSTEAKWAAIDKCGADTEVTDATMNCTTRKTCSAPGSVTFCEDTFYDASWPATWNHTVRENYRSYTWQWFKALP